MRGRTPVNSRTAACPPSRGTARGPARDRAAAKDQRQRRRTDIGSAGAPAMMIAAIGPDRQVTAAMASAFVAVARMTRRAAELLELGDGVLRPCCRCSCGRPARGRAGPCPRRGRSRRCRSPSSPRTGCRDVRGRRSENGDEVARLRAGVAERIESRDAGIHQRAGFLGVSPSGMSASASAGTTRDSPHSRRRRDAGDLGPCGR